ncbi:TonB-dependent receptor [Sphingomonas sp. PAMC 26605]|uniref:TonB-dependent receptor n=1 Tax=Sphingomonas sp. PAMC 26605 TaxID=1112214 RepID=UPI00026CA6BE|nr:TonB-dependent receptor [Sphingomonas sp. PAMC 26605]
MTIRTAFLLSSALAGLVAAVPATAQSAPENAPASSQAVTPGASNSDSDIIVTAQKRTQTLIDVPQSITVVSGAALERQQATSFQDYLNLVPGLQLDQSTPGAGRLILRGLNTGGVASTVAVYVDETPFGSSSALVNGGVLAGDFDTFDIARVEVLRGPQGTLYGASSLGGLLKFVSNTPDTTKVEGRVRAGIETTDGGDLSYHGNALINLPLGDTLALRASGFYNKVGGWIDSIGTSAVDGVGSTQTADVAKNINGSKSYGGRASLLFKPSDTFDLRLTAHIQNIRADAPSIVESDPDTLQTLYGRETQSQFANQFTNIDYRLYNGLLNYDFGFAKLTASSSYSTQNQTFRQDATFNLSGLVTAALGAPANDFVLDQQTNDRRFTEEVRLASGKSDLLEWLVGGYYTNEKGLVSQNFAAFTPNTTTPIAFPFVLGQVTIRSKYEEYAGFANATLHLGRRFDLDFGGRYSHNDQTASQGADGVLAGNVPVNSNLRSSDNVFTYSIAPKFKISDRASIYARVARGYRPGGPNVISPTAPADTPTSFAPDTVTSYEVGFKGETADHSFALDIAGYHIDWNNIQLLTVVNGFGININGSSAVSDGGEVTATFRPTRGFVTSINGAYTRARLTGDAPPLTGGLKGDRLPFTPPYSVSVNSDYNWDAGSAKPYVGGSLRFLSKQNGNFDADYRAATGRQRTVPSYVVVDLRAGVDFGRFGLELFARNLTNDEGKTSTGPTTANGLPLNPNGAIATGVIRPRTVGAAITASF